MRRGAESGERGPGVRIGREASAASYGMPGFSCVHDYKSRTSGHSRESPSPTHDPRTLQSSLPILTSNSSLLTSSM